MNSNQIAQQQRQRKEEDTELVPESEESSGETLDPGCSYDQNIPTSPITMMSPDGQRNARKAGAVVNWRSGTLRRQP